MTEFMFGLEKRLTHVLIHISQSERHWEPSRHFTALPCSEWESRPIPEEPEARFYFNHLHRHWFYPGQTEHTADRAHPTQVLEPSTYWSLHSILKKSRRRRINFAD